MTAAQVRPEPGVDLPAGRYRFRHAAAMEWIKLRSLRSTWLTVGVTFAGAVAVAVPVGVNTENAQADLTNNVLAGVVVGLLAMGVLGVLAMTGEYSAGTIGSTLATIPRRRLALAAKATVFGLVAFAVGQAAAFLAFLAGRAALPARMARPGFSDAGVLRAVVLAGVGICLVGLLGLAVGTVVRHTGAAAAALVGGVFVAAQILGAAAPATVGYVPIGIVGNSLAAVRPVAGALSPWVGLAVLSLYAAAGLWAAGWLLDRRDA